MRALLALMICIAAAPAGAAWRIGLMALSADGDRAVIAYDAEWAEVDFTTGRATLLPQPPTCDWTSASYDPKGEGGFALIALCANPAVCAAVRTELWRAGKGRALTVVAAVEGRRWNHALWRAGGGRDTVIVTETPVVASRARGLGELGRSGDCEEGAARFAAVDLASGRAAHLDILPRGWFAVAPVAAGPARMMAALRVRAGGDGHDGGGEATTTAEREAAAICRSPAADEWRRPICGEAGMKMHLIWADGDWSFLDRAPGDWGRVAATPDLATLGRETCTGQRIDGRLKTECAVAVAGPHGDRDVAAPGGLFGDLAFSADGRLLASLAAGRGLRIRRFDLFDLATGEIRDLSHLLDVGPPWEWSR